MYYERVLAVLDLYNSAYACNLTERENLQNSHCMSIRFLFEDFRLSSRSFNVNYSAWHVYEPLFGSCVATCLLSHSEISLLSINEKSLERSLGNGRT